MMTTAAHEDAAGSDEPGAPQRTFGQVMTFGLLATTVFFFVFTAAFAYVASDDLTFGLAVGAFAAVWGGPGFGVMVGGTFWHIIESRQDADAES